MPEFPNPLQDMWQTQLLVVGPMVLLVILPQRIEGSLHALVGLPRVLVTLALRHAHCRSGTHGIASHNFRSSSNLLATFPPHNDRNPLEKLLLCSSCETCKNV